MPDLRRRDAGSGAGADVASGAYDTRAMGAWLLLAILVAAPAAASLWEVAHRAQPAPGFRLLSTGYEDGVEGEQRPTNLTDYRGRTLVLDFMAVACRACRTVTAETLKPLWEEFGPRPDFAILSIDAWADPESGNATAWKGETRAELVALQKSEGVPWRHALDTDRAWLHYSAVTLPRLLVVDGSGAVVFDQVGVPEPQQVRSAVVASLAASATPVPFLALGLPALALVAGGLSVLSPCSAGLLPAYLGLLAQGSQGAARPRRILAAGLWAAAGALSLYALLAVAFAAAAPSLRPLLPWLGPAVALGLVAAGAAALAGRGVSGAGRLAARLGPRRGMALFGVAFALAGFGCTGPLFLPILALGFLDGVGSGVLLFLLYAAAVAGVLAAVAWLVAAGAQTRLVGFLRHGRGLQLAAGALLVASGLYILWYGLRPL